MLIFKHPAVWTVDYLFASIVKHDISFVIYKKKPCDLSNLSKEVFICQYVVIASRRNFWNLVIE